MTKQIKETKCICKACNHVWYYGKQDVAEAKGKKAKKCGEDMQNCGNALSCRPTIPFRDERVDLDKCPECGSRAIKKEEVIHNVD